jgi:predicted acylesterase/phospholipase RssA
MYRLRRGILMPDSQEVTFEQVLKEEQKVIKDLRNLRFGVGQKVQSLEPGQPADGMLSPVGLAFSGGGIRSATFNLGVLQGLADLGLVSIFDYLSTVSGGGYIGSWLVAWMQRKNPPYVYERLRTDWADRTEEGEPREVQFLREYSNYLTPKLGLFSGDTWAFIGAYVRNLLLNQIILGSVLIALLLLSRPLVLEFWRIAHENASWIPLALGCVLLCVALGTTISNLSNIVPTLWSSREDQLFASPWQVNLLVLLPATGAVWLLWAWWWGFHAIRKSGGHSAGQVSFYAGIGYAALWFVGWIGGGIVTKLVRWIKPPASFEVTSQSTFVRPRGQSKSFQILLENTAQAAREQGLHFFSIIFWAGVAAAAGGFLIAELTEGLEFWVLCYKETPTWHIASWGFPLAFLVFLFVQTLHIGLVGKGFSDDAREWWGRSGGMLTQLILCLSAIYAISLDGPKLFEWLNQNDHVLYEWALALAWAALTGVGVHAGRNPAKPSGGLKVSPALVAKLAPPVFVLGLLLILSFWADKLLTDLIHWLEPLPGGWVKAIDNWVGELPDAHVTTDPHWMHVEGTLHGCAWIIVAGFVLLAVFLSSRVGINRFSMHSLYQNRLARCYLGASYDYHRPQPFTGFDPGDDSVCVKDLDPRKNYAGPYPILNTTLNLLSSKNLAWQQRKAASFMVTPRYSGFELPRLEGARLSAFCRTKNYEAPITLGMAIATSGAAASPNMGAYSSPAFSFLMTIFNVRLGWWIGNPRFPSKSGRLDPRWGLLYLFNELLGRTNEDSSYVYLSDGGHFENLGIYELVRRRCRFIVACDVGEDRELKFGDLGNAIEKCRTDLGVDIEIDIEPIRRQQNAGKSKWHCAIGTIHYERLDPGLDRGTLVYMKASLTGDEPTDVQRYADHSPAFPHQTTADQWFNESQFESYRALGSHVAESTFGVLGNRQQLSRMNVEEMFVKLRQHWYPPSRYIQASFTRHTATYTSLLEKLRTSPNLRFLDAQVYPEWHALDSKDGANQEASLGLPESVDEKREGFYFCNQVIQLMEDAYLDLNLEAEFDHPDNRGWVNLFRHWSHSEMFRVTWAISASIYGARFQSFCERRLNLRPGRVQIGTPAVLWVQFKDNEVPEKLWESLKKEHVLDSWEVDLLRTFLAKCRRPGGEAPALAELAGSTLKLFPFEAVVDSHYDNSGQSLKFNIGLAVVLAPNVSPPAASIWYFRIQDHLRKMGLAHEALRALLNHFNGRVQYDVRIAPLIPAAKLAGEDPLKLEALPSAEAVQRFKEIFDSVRAHDGGPIGA